MEGLALRIVEGEVPETIKDKRLVTLDLSGMVAGSKYRGEFEERIKRVIAEVKNAGNVILFLGRNSHNHRCWWRRGCYRCL